MSSGVSEVSEWANEWAQQSAQSKRAVQSKQTNERCKQTDKQVAQYLHLDFWLFWPMVERCWLSTHSKKLHSRFRFREGSGGGRWEYDFWKTNIVSLSHWPLILVFLVFFIVHDRSEKNKNRSLFIRGLVSVLNLMEENRKAKKYVNIRKIGDTDLNQYAI